jgi:hypothetical protein
MTITWRPGTLADIEPGLSILPGHRGDALVGTKAAAAIWQDMGRDPFFASAAIESSPAIKGCRLLAYGASVMVSHAFADAEIENPQPEINSRIIASIHAGRPVLATRTQVARFNAGEGVDVVVLNGTWRYGILEPGDLQDVHTLFAKSFIERHSGFRIRRILQETVSEPESEFLLGSGVWRVFAKYAELGRVLHLMTRETATIAPASIGNILFSYKEPLLRLRESDQELLLAAVSGCTDAELTLQLGVTLSAVKARWRSVIAVIEETMPELVRDADNREGRGMQKRHRVLGYVRSHPEELRPFDWSKKKDRSVVAIERG